MTKTNFLTIDDLPEEGFGKTKEEWKEVDHLYIHYFYKITNNINGKFYYGIHSILKEDPKSNDLVNDGYWGSGTAIVAAEVKYGLENFTKTIEKTFSTRADLRLYEAEVVTEDLVKSKDCYNLTVGGCGGNRLGSKDMVTVNFADEAARKEDFFLVSREEFLKNRNLYITNASGKVVVNFSDPLKKKDKFFTVSVEEYERNKDQYITCSSNASLYKSVDNPRDVRRLSIDDPLVLSGQFIGVSNGVKRPKDKIKNFGENNGSFGSFWITNGKENKRIKGEEVPIGWRRGKISSATELAGLSKTKYINRYTKEIRSFSQKELENEPKGVWFTEAFYTKDLVFISYEYFQELYEKVPSITRISKILNRSIESVSKVKTYYESLGKVFSSTNKLSRRKKSTNGKQQNPYK